MFSMNSLYLALFVVTVVNGARYVSSLRTLLIVMRDADPLLYQSVDGRGFFSSQGNVSKQIRLFHYIRSHQYAKHHNPIFISKCEKVRHLFILTSALVLILLFTLPMVA